jgi:uncharacterized YkwD family protein
MRNMQRSLIAFLCIMLLSSASFLHAPNLGHAASGTYIVKPGDTLWKIAKTHNIGLSELLAHNPTLQKPGSIVPNQVIRITSVGSTTQAWEQQVVKLVNAERAKAGLNPLKSDWELARVARYKSMDMRDRNYFAHQSPTYGTPFEMITSFSIAYRYAGENIAAGQRSPEEVMKAWMNSSGHRANILNRNFTKIGVGFIKGGSSQTYWTQLFTG